VDAPAGAYLEVFGGTSPEPIHLNNAKGDGLGALVARENSVLTGPIDLGEQGSSIGTVSNSLMRLTLRGPVTGGSLTINGVDSSAGVRLANNANTYTGSDAGQPPRHSFCGRSRDDHYDQWNLPPRRHAPAG
jgi:hypothetical protein